MAGHRMATVVLILVVTTVACSGGNDDGPPERATTTTNSAVTVRATLPSYPAWDNDVFESDQALLDELAAEFAVAAGVETELDAERFLYGWAPVAVFEQILTEDLTRDQISSRLWTLHVSGYFGGVWLRGTIDRAQPGTSAIASVEIAPDEESFRSSVDAARLALDAAEAGGDQLLAYVEQSLFPRPGEDSGFTGDGLAQGFGYNQGYLLQILETPPEGLDTPAKYGVTCKGPLSCTYATPRLRALEPLADVEAALATGRGEYAEIAPLISVEQEKFVPQGRAVWSGGLSVEGFTQRDYETLLDVSSSFLEALQATALVAAQATAEGSQVVARRSAIANAAMGVWLRAYTSGLLEGRDAATAAPALVTT